MNKVVSLVLAGLVVALCVGSLANTGDDWQKAVEADEHSEQAWGPVVVLVVALALGVMCLMNEKKSSNMNNMCLVLSVALFGVSVYLVVESAGLLNDLEGFQDEGNGGAGNGVAGNGDNLPSVDTPGFIPGVPTPKKHSNDEVKRTVILNLVSGIMGVLLAGVVMSCCLPMGKMGKRRRSPLRRK